METFSEQTTIARRIHQEPHHTNELSTPSVILLSGSLGSGKTTTLNALLRSQDHGRYVVIENDIGSGNIDAGRVDVSEDGVLLGLTSGCICCQDLASLRQVIVDIKAGRYGACPNRIFIETTGIADPREVRQVIEQSCLPSQTFVTLDVRNFEANLRLGRITGHVDAADIVLLTHWDHLGNGVPSDHPALQHLIDTKPSAHVFLVSRQGEVLKDRPVLLPRCEALPSPCGRRISLPSLDVLEHDHHSEQHHHHDHHPHGVHSVSLELRTGLDLDDIIDTLAAIRESGVTILRAKGFVSGQGFDLVHDELERTVRAASESGGKMNLITESPVSPELLAPLRSPPPAPTLEDTISVVKELIARYPLRPLTHRGTVAVDYDADEGERYVEREGLPEDLRNDFWRTNITTRLRALDLAEDPSRAQDPLQHYYRRRLGSFLSWALLEKDKELESAGVAEAVRRAVPSKLFFEGVILTPPGEQAQLGQLNDARADFYPKLAAMLVSELGRETGLGITRRALEHAMNISLDPSWKERGPAVMAAAERLSQQHS